MLLNTIFALLLATTALATPVPEKEISVRDFKKRGDMHVQTYRPAASYLCTTRHDGRRNYGYALAAGKYCVAKNQFIVYCAHGTGRGTRHGEEPAGYPETFHCDEGYQCVEVIGETDNPAPPGYVGAMSVVCMREGASTDLIIKQRTHGGQTEWTHMPPSHSGTMVAHLELIGNVRGAWPRPRIEVDYKDNENPGGELVGDHVLTANEVMNSDKNSVHYYVKFNFNNDARFRGLVEYLDPRHTNQIELKLGVSYFSHALAAQRYIEDREAMYLASQRSAGNAERDLDTDQSAE